MTGEDVGRHGLEGADTASLHTLDVRLETIKRLLERRAGDGALVQADRALIETAIESARRNLCDVKDLLATVPNDPAHSYLTTAKVMAEAVAELDALLDGLKGSMLPRS